MKLIKGFLPLIIIGLLVLPVQSNAQANQQQMSLGIGVKASTSGFGADLIYSLSSPITLRLGFDRIGFQSLIPFDEQGISYEGNLSAQTGSISLMADFYLGDMFFISGGIAKSLLKVSFDGKADKPLPFGDIEIPVEMIGDFNFEITPESMVMPYLGLGLGRTIGLNKAVGFAFEVGCFYLGPLGIDIESTGLLSPTSNPDHGHAERLKKQMEQYIYYPVAKLSLSYKIANF